MSLSLCIEKNVSFLDNSFMWSDKTMLSYTNWRAGRPAVKNGKFFAGLSTDGFWDIQTLNTNEEILYFHQHSILACKIEMGKCTNTEFPLLGKNVRLLAPLRSLAVVFSECLLWIQSNERCYRIYRGRKDTVTGAMVFISRSKMQLERQH